MRSARIVAATALVVLSACSGASPKEEFIEQADRLCREADERTRGLEAPRTPEGLREFVEHARQVSVQLLEDLRKLETPEADVETIERMLTQMDQAIDYLPRLARAAQRENTEAMARIGQKLQEAAAEADRIAREYGLRDCGRADSAPTP